LKEGGGMSGAGKPVWARRDRLEKHGGFGGRDVGLGVKPSRTWQSQMSERGREIV